MLCAIGIMLCAMHVALHVALVTGWQQISLLPVVLVGRLHWLRRLRSPPCTLSGSESLGHRCIFVNSDCAHITPSAKPSVRRT